MFVDDGLIGVQRSRFRGGSLLLFPFPDVLLALRWDGCLGFFMGGYLQYLHLYCAALV